MAKIKRKKSAVVKVEELTITHNLPEGMSVDVATPFWRIFGDDFKKALLKSLQEKAEAKSPPKE